MATSDGSNPVPLQTYELRSDSQGAWQLDIDESIPPGPHIVNVEDQYGNQNEVLMYVVADSQSAETAAPASANQLEIIDRLTTVLPPFFSWLILLLFAIIAVLSLNLVRLAHRADQSAAAGEKKRHLRHALAFALIIILAASLTGLLINRETNFLSPFFPKKAAITEVKLSGRLLSPQNGQGVPGVDMVSGNTSLRTSSSGQYIFDHVGAASGLRVTYATLSRALVILPPAAAAEEVMNLYFDPEMFNALIRVIDLEARGRLGDVYNYLPAAVQSQINRADFTAKAQTIYNSQNVADQEIKIRATRLLDQWTAKDYQQIFYRVVAVTVAANGREDQYWLVRENGAWVVVK